MNSRTLFRFGSWVLLGIAMVVTGCASQGEGERCDSANANLDCQSGLLCTPINNTSYALCCPPSQQIPSVAACSNAAAPAPVDAAVVTTPDAEAGAEGGADAEAGAGGEAGQASPADDADSAAEESGEDTVEAAAP